tara:strand:+ start:564 stop:938 length:375 start_codon:yes stop_codon:yes gene_type:complete
MKFILSLIFLISAYTYTLGEPPLEEYVSTRNPHYDNPMEKQEDLVTKTANLILSQGFSGAIIVCLFFYIWRNEKSNRSTNQENFNKFIELSEKTSEHMAKMASAMSGVERELEQTKTMEMLRKG